MNADDTKTLYDSAVSAYVFAQAHYYYYIGVLMRMCFTPFNLKEFVRYFLASLLLVQATRHLLELNGSPILVTMFVCIVLGFTGHTGLKYAIDDAMPRILKAITDKIIDWIGKK